jgi:hypothetical protein
VKTEGPETRVWERALLNRTDLDVPVVTLALSSSDVDELSEDELISSVCSVSFDGSGVDPALLVVLDCPVEDV